MAYGGDVVPLMSVPKNAKCPIRFLPGDYYTPILKAYILVPRNGGPYKQRYPV